MKHTDLVVILDRSGSMANLRSDMEAGFDGLIAAQRKLEGTCNVTLVQFDSGGIETVYTGTPVADVPPLKLEPRGSTPLLDAVGTTVERIRQQVEALPADQRPEQVMVLIITDGYENASVEYKKAQVQKLVGEARAKGWEFVYLGANVDAFAEAGNLGISAMSAAAYSPDSASVRYAYVAASQNLAQYRSSGVSAFTSQQRQQLTNAAQTVTERLRAMQRAQTDTPDQGDGATG